MLHCSTGWYHYGKLLPFFKNWSTFHALIYKGEELQANHSLMTLPPFEGMPAIFLPMDTNSKKVNETLTLDIRSEVDIFLFWLIVLWILDNHSGTPHCQQHKACSFHFVTGSLRFSFPYPDKKKLGKILLFYYCLVILVLSTRSISRLQGYLTYADSSVWVSAWEQWDEQL